MISTKGRYALRVMVSLAEKPAGQYVSLKSIAEEQDISEKYLESIVSLLVKNGLLDGLRGKGGGYRLTKSPDSCNVADILTAAEGTLAPVSCLEVGSKKCARKENCKTLPVFKKLNTVIYDYLSSVTLADIINESEDGGNYVI